MKYILLAALTLLASNSAHAYLGYPSYEEMNKVTIQKVKAIVSNRGDVGNNFTIQTVRLNNKYLITSANGCSYTANVEYGEFGWPYIDGVRLGLISCK